MAWTTIRCTSNQSHRVYLQEKTVSVNCLCRHGLRKEGQGRTVVGRLATGIAKRIGLLKSAFFNAGAISQDRDRCQFLFCLMKTHGCTGLGPESGRERAKASVRRRSFELRASDAIGLRWQAVSDRQIIWNRLTRRAVSLRCTRYLYRYRSRCFSPPMEH